MVGVVVGVMVGIDVGVGDGVEVEFSMSTVTLSGSVQFPSVF
jgi:hypothetical protein